MSSNLIKLPLIGVLLIMSVIAYFQVIQRGWHLSESSSEALFDQLKPFIDVQFPEGEGPFPVVVGFHGCGGVAEGEKDWMALYRTQGYATVHVDSFAHRDSDWWLVCYGASLQGSERAGDVAAVLDGLKQWENIDTDRIALVGWSHGAWSIMELMTNVDDNTLPTNLNALPQNILAGVKASILFYPYCAYPAKTNSPWQLQIPSQMHIAEKDSIVPNSACIRMQKTFEAQNYPFETVFYPGVNHAFDMRNEDFKGHNSLERNEEALIKAQQHVLRFLNAKLSNS